MEFFGTTKPRLIKVHGKGDGPQGSFRIDGLHVSGSATFPLASLKTGISLRDQHMREKYLETSRYPEAKFTLTSCDLPGGFAGQNFSGEGISFQGTLLLHGVVKPVQGQVSIRREVAAAQAQARFALKLRDFGISEPNYAGLGLADDVEVLVSFSSSLEKRP